MTRPAACGRLYKEVVGSTFTAYNSLLTALPMFRKSLTILSLLGLLLSVGGACLDWHVAGDCFELDTGSGMLVFQCYAYYPDDTVPRRELYWSSPKFSGMEEIFAREHLWGWPWRGDHGEIWIHLGVPILFFASILSWCCLPFHRRRKRKKLGLCIKCGYDLRGSKDRCPECGEER